MVLKSNHSCNVYYFSANKDLRNEAFQRAVGENSNFNHFTMQRWTEDGPLKNADLSQRSD